MINVNPWRLTPILVLLMLATVGCGGDGGGSSSTEPPPIDPPNFVIELPSGLGFDLLTGKISLDFDNCQSEGGATDEAQFSDLSRVTVYEDAVYLADTGATCTNVSRGPFGGIGSEPSHLQPKIRKLSEGTVKNVLALHSYRSFSGLPPSCPMVGYPSGFYRKADTGEIFVLSYVTGNRWDSTTGAWDWSGSKWNWNNHVPGLFKFVPYGNSGLYLSCDRVDYFVAGSLGEPPTHADGTGRAARFTTPSDLEVDAAGLFYLIDDRRIRTIDSSYTVKTLGHAALGITDMETPRAIDSDHQGNIHVLTQFGNYGYTWHRLADGSRISFYTRPGDWGTTIPSFVTFTVTGDSILLGVHMISSYYPPGDYPQTRLYHVSATGEVTELTAEGASLPLLRHIEYGVDGHLYLVLPQGVLIARDYDAK